MSNTTNIQWLIGDTTDSPLHPQAYDMLETSIRFLKLLLPDAHRFIATPHIAAGYSHIEEIATRHDCNVVYLQELDVIKEFPLQLRPVHRRSAWWKYMQPTINNLPTLHLDNDFLIWRLPPQLDAWIDDGELIGYGIESGNPVPADDNDVDWSQGIHFGTKAPLVRELAGTMALNSGLYGVWPEIELPYPLTQIGGFKRFVEDQAWWTINFALAGNIYTPKHIIHYEEDVPILSKYSEYYRSGTSADDIYHTFYGAHFSGHNTGFCQYYSTHFHDYLKSKLIELEG